MTWSRGCGVSDYVPDRLSEECLALPPGPLCERCQHQLCPCCSLPWCDSLLESEDPDGFGDLCCDGDCVVDAYDFEAWQRHVAAVRAEHPAFRIAQLQDGPPRPYALERARGVGW